MKKTVFLLFVLLLQFSFCAQVQIRGFAPQFIGKEFEAWEITDHLTQTKHSIQKANIDEKGYFSFSLPCTEISKIVIGNPSYNGFLYIQPKANYKIGFISENPQNDSYNLKEEIELTFYDLDSNDVNFKILGFQSWLDNYLADIYVLQDANHPEFIRNIANLKKTASQDFINDSSEYFRCFIKYSIGLTVDNLKYIGAPTLLDKYKVYLKDSPVAYKNDAYIEYFKTFYDQYIFQLEPSISKELFGFVAANDLYSCDTLLSNDLYLSNPELRSLVLLYILKQGCNGNFFPQSVLLNMLQKIALESKYPEQREIANHLVGSMTQVGIGNEFLEIKIPSSKGNYKVNPSLGKYLYIHAFHPSNTQCLSEIGALKKLQSKYGDKIEFVTFYVNGVDSNSTDQRNLNQITWEKIGLNQEDPLWAQMGITTYPYYILIDKEFVVLASPALSPTPNGKYETIEKTFYELTNP